MYLALAGIFHSAGGLGSPSLVALTPSANAASEAVVIAIASSDALTVVVYFIFVLPLFNY